ncbi:hypothetical protein [Methanospirillum hungatei]|uniref:hypothetical protein n=1 Tax=Methanospirillum hungatei TaxID=2203 RepID=UPI0026EC9769|nr:hypothetical protein [Methanospirillum hungatei]MCA1917601.1 hypothetical protein [Methanospirillum hungatei]
MDIGDLNQKAWEIAASAMIRKGKDIESYSIGQVRFFFEQARSSRFEHTIKEELDRYSPQPSDGRGGNDPKVIAEMNARKNINKKVGSEVISVMKGLSVRERMRFVQYLLWNIRIIEQLHGDESKIRQVLCAEQVRNPDAVIEKIPKVQIQQNF